MATLAELLALDPNAANYWGAVSGQAAGVPAQDIVNWMKSPGYNTFNPATVATANPREDMIASAPAAHSPRTTTGGQIPGPIVTDKSFADLLGGPSGIMTTAPPGSAPGATAGVAPGPAPIPMPTSGQGYDLNIAPYLNPQEKFLQDWAGHDLASTYASRGDLLSGDAARGITDYSQKLAQASSWAPATATAQQQQGTAIDLGKYNQQFQNTLALENQTIPFNQELQLAQMGLTGAQGQSAISQFLAAILSQNAAAAGQAGGAGTIGQSNAITQAIAAALSGALGSNFASTFAQMLQRGQPAVPAAA